MTWRTVVRPALLALILAVVGTGIYCGWGRPIDTGLWSDQRAILRDPTAGLRTFGDSSAPRLVRTVEQSVGLKGLRFEKDPLPSARDIRPVLDQNGRIAGFLTWQRTYPTTRSIGGLLPIAVLLVTALAGITAFSCWQLKRARLDLSESEEAARRAADEDKLTGLSNHAKTLEVLDLALTERRPEQVTTFALIGLDGMADVNAGHGVLASDELTVSVARRLQESLPPQAICGRIGSNEFAATFTAAAEFDAEAAIRAALTSITRPHWIDTVVRVGAHAGFAQAPRSAETCGELTRHAELSLREAARKGPGSVVVFDPAIDATSEEQKFIRRELPRALSANDFDVHYQPIVSAQDRRVIGIEALLRWTHSTRGPIGPASFIPVAEQMGLMDQLGAFVLRRALAEAEHWPDIYVAVNLSPLQVRDRGIVDLVHSALAESGVPPSRLMLEITEGVLIDEPEEMLRRIEELHALGVRFALDDFGSGYSNLGYLQRFPFDKLKIDRSFVSALGRSASGGVIIQAIVALGRALGLSVLVEGVETEEQRTLLRLAGCDEMQGFLFARPAPPRAIDRLLGQVRAETGAAAALGALPEPLTA